MFLGRAAELRLLEQAYQSPESAFVPIYGRRRVGKSELILRFLSGKPGGLYYVGKVAPAPLQRAELMGEAARVIGEPLLRTFPAGSWATALQTLEERWKGPGKLVLVLDEFQWMVGASPELPSVLQEAWDRRWRRSGQVMLILCGSFVGFMEREVLGQGSPLFGRRTAQIKLQPFGYREAALFHPHWSTTDRAMAYFLVGGIPLYLRLLDASDSIETNIERVLLGEFSPLLREPEFLLREELREVENYHAVLTAIAGGHTVVKDMAQQSGIPERSLPYYLEQLVQLGYVARRHPLTGGPVPKRTVRYVLDDALLRFWFRFVFPNLSFLSQMGPRRTFRERIRPELEAYAGGCFERLCREALPALYEREGVGAAFSVGEFWDRAVQLDVVGVRDDNVTDLGECKWGTVRSLPGLQAELEAKVPHYPNRRGATLQRRYFLHHRPKSGWPDRKATPGARFHDLEDLYGGG
jgi:AAA+ ATPase superfamily predicted ATPase